MTPTLPMMRAALISGLRRLRCWRWRQWILAFTIVITVAMTGVAGYAYTLATFKAPAPTLLLLDRHDRFLAEDNGKPGTGSGYWQLRKLPPRVVAATLALEDKRFWHHPGVDPLAVVRAAWQDLSSGHIVSGASTIAMQVARMQHPGPRTFSRKLVESFTALFLTARYGRRAVLKQYLRLVPYGNDIHGIAYAARRYLDRPVSDLSWAEIAFLSAIPQAPGETNPFTYDGRRRAIRRGRQILKTLRKRGVINAATYALAKLQLGQLRLPAQQPRPLVALHAIIKLKQLLRRNKRWRSVAGAPIIHTTLDLGMQRYLAQLATRMLQRWHDAGAQQVAVIVLKRKSRQVLAWLGSGGYFDSVHGAIDYTQVLRSPGSTLKPFVYAHALDRGTITPGTVLYDLPDFSNGFSDIDRRFLGPMLPREALANSRNVPATWLVHTMGLDETYNFFGLLGLQDGTLPADYYGVGMTIGTLPVTLEQLVRAYGVIADDGMLKNLVWIRGAKPRLGIRLVSVASARLVTRFLADPMARLPSFARMGTTEYPFPVAIKTGTSQNYRDAWAVAFSKRYLVGVWVGRPDAMPMRHLGGAGSAADLAQHLLLHLYGESKRDGMDDVNFPMPPGYKRYTGERATGLCTPTLTELFPATRPPPLDNHYLRLWVDSRTNRIAGPNTPRRYLKPRTFIKLPTFLLPWAAQHHIAALPMGFSEEGLALQNIVGPADRPLLQALIHRTDRPVKLTLESPNHTMHLYTNPGVPPAMNTLALRVTAQPEVGQVVWYVDGKPYKLASPPSYTVNWQLEKGHHTFQARLPYRPETSAVISVDVN